MAIEIQLSEKSRELLQKLGTLTDAPLMKNATIAEILEWINSSSAAFEASNGSLKDWEFIIASLRVHLLRDLYGFLDHSNQHTKKVEKPTRATRVKFIFLAIAGSIAAACGGFDIMVSLLGSVSATSSVVLFAGLIFSALSVVVFLGFNLAQVSVNLNIKLSNAPKLLHSLFSQRDELKSIRRALSRQKLSQCSHEDLLQFKAVAEMLKEQGQVLSKTSKQFNEAIHSPKMKVAKYLFSGLAGLVFVLGGFLSGQSVATFILSAIFGAMAPTAWPVILCGLVVGAAAFCLYWYVERVGLDRFIGSWFGLDEEKIELLCDEHKISEEAQKVSDLYDRIDDCISYHEKPYQGSQQSFFNKLDDIAPPETPLQIEFKSEPEPTLDDISNSNTVALNQ